MECFAGTRQRLVAASSRGPPNSIRTGRSPRGVRMLGETIMGGIVACSFDLPRTDRRHPGAPRLICDLSLMRVAVKARYALTADSLPALALGFTGDSGRPNVSRAAQPAPELDQRLDKKRG